MEGIFEMLSFLKDTECFANLQNEHFKTLATRYMVIKIFLIMLMKNRIQMKLHIIYVYILLQISRMSVIFRRVLQEHIDSMAFMK